MKIKLEKAFDYYIFFSYVMYFAVIFGVFTTVPEYLDELNSLVKLLIAFILLFKFNPFQQNYIVTKFDKKIIFTSGIYLLLTTVVGEYLVRYNNILHEIIKKNIN